MEAVRKFLARKNIVFSARRYFIDAMGAMAQGLFCTLLVGTILNTIGQQLHIGFLTEVIVTLGKGEDAVTYTIGGLCSAMVGPGMAVAIGRALEAPPLVLFSLFWKRINRAGAIAGMVGGGLMVFFWKLVIRPFGGVWNIYELLPAFLFSCICIVVASLLTAPPSAEILADYEAVNQGPQEA